MKLEVGKYYECVMGHVYKRTGRAKRPYLPCGHFTKREITEQEYKVAKKKK